MAQPRRLSRASRWLGQEEPPQDEEATTAPLQPPFLSRSDTQRHSAYHDAMQQLDGHDERSVPLWWTNKGKDPKPPGLTPLESMGRLWSMVRGRSSQEPPPVPTRSGSGEDRLKEKPSISVSACKELFQHEGETSPSTPPSTTGRMKASILPPHSPHGDRGRGRGRTISIGISSSDSQGGVKIPAVGSRSAFAFMTPEPFVGHKSIAQRLRAVLLQPLRLIEAGLLVLIGMSSAMLAVLVVQLPRTASGLRASAVAAASSSWVEAWPQYAWLGRPVAYLTHSAFSLTAALLALAATLPAVGGSRHAVGSGIPEMKAIMSGYWLPRYLSLRTFIAKIVGLTSALSAGYVIGKEGPMVHLSATLSVLLMKLPPFADAVDTHHTRKRSMLAAACAVGVVSTFGTPIGGVLFSIEVTSVYYMVGNLWKGFFGAMTAVICFQVAADQDVFQVPETKFVWQPHVGWEYVFFLVVGVLQGLLSACVVGLMSATATALRRRKLLKTRRFTTGLSVCLACTTLRYIFPPMGVSQHSLLSDLFTHRPLDAAGAHWQMWDGHEPADGAHGHGRTAPGTLLALGVFAALELLLLISSIVLPIPNGCFFPIFVVGAASGRLYAELAQMVLGYDSDELPAAVVSVVGAAALAAGTTQTLSTALICLEFTRQQQLLIPVLLAVVASCAVSGTLSNSIYDQILVLKDFPYMPHLRTEALVDLKAEDIMRPTEAVTSAAFGTSDDAGGQRGRGATRTYRLPATNPYHPLHAPSTPLVQRARPQKRSPLRVLTSDMKVRDVVQLLNETPDRYIPLLESIEQPLLLGSVMRTQLLGWFQKLLAILQEYEDEDDMCEPSEVPLPLNEVDEEGSGDLEAEAAIGTGASKGESSTHPQIDAKTPAAARPCDAPVPAVPMLPLRFCRAAEAAVESIAGKQRAASLICSTPRAPDDANAFAMPPTESSPVRGTSAGVSVSLPPSPRLLATPPDARKLSSEQRLRRQTPPPPALSARISAELSSSAAKRKDSRTRSQSLTEQGQDAIDAAEENILPALAEALAGLTASREQPAEPEHPSLAAPAADGPRVARPEHRRTRTWDVAATRAIAYTRITSNPASPRGAGSLSARASIRNNLGSPRGNSTAAGGAPTDGKPAKLLRAASSYIFPRLADDEAAAPRDKNGPAVELSMLRFSGGRQNRSSSGSGNDSPSPTKEETTPPFLIPNAEHSKSSASAFGALREEGPPLEIDEDLLSQLVDLNDDFPFDEVDFNRCALQLSTETCLDEIHSLFSFMSMGHVWITAGGKLCGVVSDRALIEACLPSKEARL